MAKPKKSAMELAAIVMQRLRQDSECQGITGVTVIRPLTRSWDVALTQNGVEIANRRAFEIAHEFARFYDLAPPPARFRKTRREIVDILKQTAKARMNESISPMVLPRTPKQPGAPNWHASFGIDTPGLSGILAETQAWYELGDG